MSHEPFKIFFICTGNSARSQLAEGLANHLGAGRVDARSAGTLPVGVNDHAVAVMKERGIDISRQYSKRIDEVQGPFDLVITLCDSAAMLCPVSVRAYPTEHWSTPDPTFVPGGPEAVRQSFRDVRDRLEKQIAALVERVRPAAGAGAGDDAGAGGTRGRHDAAPMDAPTGGLRRLGGSFRKKLARR